MKFEPCEFCAKQWPMCPACAELHGGMDTCCPHCSDSKGHVSPEAHADFLALEAEVCDQCGCDRVNGYVLGEDCPDCELCCCGHNAFAHVASAAFYEQTCYECPCLGFASQDTPGMWRGRRSVELVVYRRWLPVLFDAEYKMVWELRTAWATGRRVALSLERCDFDRMEGIVTRVAASDAYVRLRGRLVPLDRVLALHWPSRLGDSDHGRRAAGWAGVGRRARQEPQEETLW